jgi:hypothetical protein
MSSNTQTPTGNNSSIFDSIKNKVTNEFSKINLNDVATSLLYLTLVLYASFVRPDLPKFMETLFKNNLFRILVFFLIVYLAEKEGNVTLALLIAVVFFVTMNLLTEREVEEKLSNHLKNNEENNMN